MTPWRTRQWSLFGVSAVGALAILGPLGAALIFALWFAVKVYRTRGQKVVDTTQVRITWWPEFGTRDFRRQLFAAGVREAVLTRTGTDLRVFAPALHPHPFWLVAGGSVTVNV